MGNSKRPLVIFHGSKVDGGFGGCADGFGAAFAAWLKLGDEAEYLPMQYGFGCKDIPPISGREVYLLDFSWPKDQTERLFRKTKRLVWLDHHASVFKDYDLLPGRVVTEFEVALKGSFDAANHHIRLDNSKSGAMLAWEYFHPRTEAPMLIKHIDDYDRWQFKIEGTKGLNKAIWSYAPFRFETWRDWLSRPSALPGLLVEGAAILRAHEQNVKAVVEGAARRCELVIVRSGVGFTSIFTGLATNCPAHLSSDVGQELANLSGTFGLCWHMAKDGKVRCSLRSNGDYDVSAIARTIGGGGGHRNAAGFETTIETLVGWLR